MTPEHRAQQRLSAIVILDHEDRMLRHLRTPLGRWSYALFAPAATMRATSSTRLNGSIGLVRNASKPLCCIAAVPLGKAVRAMILSAAVPDRSRSSRTNV